MPKIRFSSEFKFTMCSSVLAFMFATIYSDYRLNKTNKKVDEVINVLSAYFESIENEYIEEMFNFLTKGLDPYDD